MKTRMIIWLAALALAAPAVLSGDLDLRGVKITAQTKANWKKNCMSCHGKDGRGRTRAGRKARVKNFADAKYQKSFTNERAIRQIKEGMKDKKGKERMKSYAAKLTDPQIKELVKFIRTLVKAKK